MTSLVTATRGGDRLRPIAAAVMPWLNTVPVPVLAGVLVIGVGSDLGGYYPQSWARIALAAAAVAAVALIRGGPIPLVGRDWLAFGGFTGWLAILGSGSMRPGAATAGVPELQRSGMYVAVFWAALLVLRRETVARCVGGLLAGTVVISGRGLVDTLFRAGSAPDPFEGRLLHLPLGYANAMGIVAAFGLVLAGAVTVHGRTSVTRASAAAATIPLAAALALTASRGAQAAFAVGLAVLVTLDPARQRVVRALAAVGPLALATAAVAVLSHAADAQAPPSVVAHGGQLVAVTIVLLAGVAAVFGGLLAERSPGRSFRAGQPLRLPLFTVGALVVAIGIIAAVPHLLADRVPFWRAAWADAMAHPLIGSGPGSFPAAWLRYRAVPQGALDAHNLYLQTLAEVGPIGLVVLSTALALPLTVVRRAATQSRYGPAAAAAYVAFLAHAAIDWDWQMPAVTLPALVLAACLLAAARGARSPAVPLSLAASTTGALAIAACIALVGNSALSGASGAASAHDWPNAARLAERAARWQPWSADPLVVLGQAQAATGDVHAAQASFARATSLAPEDWLAWYDLALASRGSLRRRALNRIATLVPDIGDHERTSAWSLHSRHPPLPSRWTPPSLKR